MGLEELSFYFFIGLAQMFSLALVTFSEDLKSKKVMAYCVKISIGIGLTGIILGILNWSLFSISLLLIFSFSSLITIVSFKIVFVFFQRVFKKEPYMIHYGSLTHGFWVRNKGDIKNKWYYAIYSTVLLFTPFLICAAIFLATRN